MTQGELRDAATRGLPGRRTRGAAGERPVAAAALGAALLALGLALGLQKISSEDYWWHLRSGAWIVEHGSVPKTDPFSYTIEGRRWIDSHWLFQLGLAGVHALGGHEAVVVAQTVLVVLLLAILAPLGFRRERAWLSALGLALLLLAAAPRFLPRPELPTLVLLAAVLGLLERHDRRGDAWVYAIVPLQLVWANLHGLFALGLALCACYLLSDLVDAWRGASRRGHVRRLALVSGLSAAAACLNPNGIEGALYPLTLLGALGPAGEHTMSGLPIVEFRPAWHPALEKAKLVAPGLLALLLAGALLANRRRASHAHFLAGLAFLYLGLRAERNLALFAVVAAPLFVRNANEALERRPLPQRLHAAAALALLSLLVAASIDAARGRFFERIGVVREPGLGYTALHVPEGAADWILRERPAAPLAHTEWAGGYLAWRLHPEYRVMLDPRLELYADTFADLMFTTPAELQRLDAFYRFGTVLVGTLWESPYIFAWLNDSPEWRLVFADDVAAVFVRPGADGSPQWPALDPDAPDFLAEPDPAPGPLDLARRRRRVVLFAGLRRFDRALAELDAGLARYPEDRILRRARADILRGLAARDRR